MVTDMYIETLALPHITQLNTESVFGLDKRLCQYLVWVLIRRITGYLENDQQNAPNYVLFISCDGFYMFRQ
jgi:uncharacterized protein YqcC (DUF446 family)